MANDVLLCAAVGGLLVNGLAFLELHNVPKAQRPDFRDPLYWLPFFLWPMLGVFLVWLYTAPDVQLTRALALNIGLSAPLILRSMAAANPLQKRIDPGAGA